MTFPWRTTAILATGALALGLLAGWRVASLTETDIINAAAERHVAGGGQAEDCAAVPGLPPVWITVVCAGDPPRIFRSDRLGRLTEIDPADAALESGA